MRQRFLELAMSGSYLSSHPAVRHVGTSRHKRPLTAPGNIRMGTEKQDVFIICFVSQVPKVTYLALRANLCHDGTLPMKRATDSLT